MRKKISKQWQLTLTYFTPVFIIFSIFVIFILFSYSNQIYKIDDEISQIAMEDAYSENSAPYIDEIISDEDWETLSQMEIDQKLIDSGINPIGDKNDFFYKMKPDEIDKFFEENDNNINVIGIESEMLNYNSYPSISIEDIEGIQEDIFDSFLDNIFFILLIITTLFGFLAHFFAKKSLNPLREALNKQKRFISDSSHEIKTPLALMKSEAEILLRNGSTSITEYKQFAKNVLEDVNRLDVLSKSLLQLAQLDQSKSDISSEKINILNIIEDVSKRFKSILKNKKCSLATHYCKNNTVYINRNHLIQLITIILDNACKYADNDTEITVFTIEKANTIELIIENKGNTISAKDLKHIFDRFYRVSKDRNKKGYGLGLSIAKEIINLYDGDITIKSKNNITSVKIIFTKFITLF